MNLNSLKNNHGAKKKSKRLGRGIGSGKGKTCGRGVKGQKSRSGVAIKGFEGGQMPLIARLPKRGFRSRSKIESKIINIADIIYLIDEKLIDANEVISKEKLYNLGLIKNTNTPIKLLGRGDELKYAINVQLDSYSNTVKSSIENAGGKIIGL